MTDRTNVTFHGVPFELNTKITVTSSSGIAMPGLVRGYALDYKGDLRIDVGMKVAGTVHEVMMRYAPAQCREGWEEPLPWMADRNAEPQFRDLMPKKKPLSELDREFINSMTAPDALQRAAAHMTIDPKVATHQSLDLPQPAPNLWREVEERRARGECTCDDSVINCVMHGFSQPKGREDKGC